MKNEDEVKQIVKPKKMNIKQDSNMKWLILFLCCCSIIGDYFCFDNPGALQSLLKRHFNETSAEDFNYMFSMMYSIYSIPNILLPLVGGVLILKLGNRTVFLGCSFFVTLGQFLFALGVSRKSPLLTLLGRAVFGLGGETLNTAQSTMLISWFAPNKISMVFGISLSLARMGSVLNDVFSPKIATSTNLDTSLWVGFALCNFSLLCIYYLISLPRLERRC